MATSILVVLPAGLTGCKVNPLSGSSAFLWEFIRKYLLLPALAKNMIKRNALDYDLFHGHSLGAWKRVQIGQVGYVRTDGTLLPAGADTAL